MKKQNDQNQNQTQPQATPKHSFNFNFTGKHVFHANSGTILTFGTVQEQIMRENWLYLRIKWEDNLSELPAWHKAVNVGIFDKDELTSRIQSL